MTMTDFTIYAGDSKVLVVTVRDDDGVLVDLAGATIKWSASQLLSGAFSAEASIMKDDGDGIEVTGTGVFEVELLPADTESLSGKFYHEAEITDVEDNIFTVLTGRMTVKPALIRAAS